MKSRAPTDKTTQKAADDPSRDSSAGENTAALAPPDCGIGFVDARMPAPVQRVGRLEEEEKKPIQGKFDAAGAAPARTEPAPAQTGMPDSLKAGIESLSGMDMSDVRVHANSGKPAQINAHAYTQGNDIHLAPGQERHLPHEAWHVVQQRQGRVKATIQAKGVAINDDATLEKEADVMGERARNASPIKAWARVQQATPRASAPPPARHPGRYAGPADSTVTQRALTTSPATGTAKATIDGHLAANPQAMTRFQVGEVLSNTWGDDSDTSEFTNANGSADVDGKQNVTWDGTQIGYIRPLGTRKANGGFDPHVKMHLVNSFLHEDANGWKKNWVFGPHELNARHTPLEGAAKKEHPHTKAANYGLSYRAEVTGYDDADVNDTEFRDAIRDAIAAAAPVGWPTPNNAAVVGNAQVNDQSLEDYAGAWNTALENHVVAHGIQVEYQAYRLDASNQVIARGVQTPAPAETDAKSTFDYVHEAESDAMVGAGIIAVPADDVGPRRSKREKKGV